MFSYGLGDAGTGLVATQFGFFLFKFFISAGLPVIIAGSLLMFIKIWDAINDPLIGWLSDRTKSRWGPRIPWMVAASVPLGFSLAAIWWTPTGSLLTKTIYYAIISIAIWFFSVQILYFCRFTSNNCRFIINVYKDMGRSK